MIAAGTPTPAVTKNIAEFKKSYKIELLLPTCSKSEACSSITGDNEGIATGLTNCVSQRSCRSDMGRHQESNDQNGGLHGGLEAAKCQKKAQLPLVCPNLPFFLLFVRLFV